MTGVVTVLTPPTSSRLTTLTAARQQTGAGLTAAEDAYLTSLIDRASAMVTQYCGTTFGNRRLQEVFHQPQAPSYYSGASATTNPPPPSNVYWSFAPLVLSGAPVSTIETVIEGNSNTALDPTCYELDGALFRLQSGNRSWWNPPKVTVTYWAGYILPGDLTVQPLSTAPASLPADIEAATLALIQAGYSARASNPAIVMEWVEGVGRVQYGRNPTVAQMLVDTSIAAMLSGHVNRVW